MDAKDAAERTYGEAQEAVECAVRMSEHAEQVL
jgi:hypothetical protein